jgi:hypothetical protein
MFRLFKKTEPLQESITIHTKQDGLFRIIITQSGGRTVYDDTIFSDQKKIVLKGFSKKDHHIQVISST